MTFILDIPMKVLILPKQYSVSGGMKNLLIELEEASVEHFISKSFVTCEFDEDEYRTEYYIYHKLHHEIGKWNDKMADHQNLRFKVLSRFERDYLRKNIHKYKVALENVYGTIYTNKSIGFNHKKRRKQSIQLNLFN